MVSHEYRSLTASWPALPSAAARSLSISTMCASLIPAIAAYLRACRVPSRPAPTTAARSSANGYGIAVYRHVFRAREFERAIAFENQRDAGFKANHRRAYFGE